MQAQNIEQLKAQFKAEFLAAPRKQDAIFNWRNKNRRSCIFHPGQMHKFLRCRITEAICQECNQSHELVTAIFNSEQSTRQMLLERGVAPESSPTNNTSIEEQVHVRRIAARANTESPATSPDPAPVPTPTPPSNQNDFGSETSSSSYNSINHGLDPYLYINSEIPSDSSLVLHSILNPFKSHKHVSFHSTVKFQNESSISQQHLELQKVPTNITQNTAITDSGCTHDMSAFRDLFEYLVYFKVPWR